MTIDTAAVSSLMAELPEALRGIRPEGRAWTVSRASYVRALHRYVVFHLDAKKLVLRVWLMPWKDYQSIYPKHGSIKDYIIKHIKPTSVYQENEKTIFDENEWKQTTLFAK